MVLFAHQKKAFSSLLGISSVCLGKKNEIKERNGNGLSDIDKKVRRAIFGNNRNVSGAQYLAEFISPVDIVCLSAFVKRACKRLCILYISVC